MARPTGYPMSIQQSTSGQGGGCQCNNASPAQPQAAAPAPAPSTPTVPPANIFVRPHQLPLASLWNGQTSQPQPQPPAPAPAPAPAQASGSLFDRAFNSMSGGSSPSPMEYFTRRLM